jgi:DNA invertase Pin-like site-specific DNA recombinase
MNGDSAPGGDHRIGYVRVSIRQPDLAPQLAHLQHAGCERSFATSAPARSAAARSSTPALDYLRPSDTLVVWRLARLGRSLHHLIDLIARLEQRNVAFLSLGWPCATRRHDHEPDRPGRSASAAARSTTTSTFPR